MNTWIAMNDKNESQTLDKYQITRFADDVEPTTYVKPEVSRELDWMTSAQENRKHTVEDVLSRPVIIAGGTFSPTFSSVAYEFPKDLIDASPNLKDKLNYYEFLRADIKIRLVFNATPFQQGKYWLFFSPYDTASGRGNTGTLPNITGYPGVELDIASGAPVELTIPYCSPLSHFRLSDGTGTMGDLRIQSIVDISDGSTSSCGFTVFAWFENIDLCMPTNLEAQMEEAKEQTSKSTIRVVADTVADVADTVSGIPFLSEIAKPVEWVARAFSGALAAFGFNKPTSEAAVQPYANVPGKGYTQMDGLDNSAKLSAIPDNCITTPEGIFSSKVDEMDLNFVTRKSCIAKAGVTWTPAHLAGHNLFRWINSPASVDSPVLNTVLNPTTLNYVASMFRYWRGGVKYRLTVTKTAFHTGRLRVSFVPRPGAQDASPVTGVENCHNWIIDLSKSSELEFVVPYVNNVPWTQCVLRDGNSYTTETSNLDSTGFLVFEVLTPLRAASDSVSPFVTLVLWHSGADDIEFAIPEFTQAIVSDVADTPPIFDAQIFNATDPAVKHEEQMNDTSVQMFGTNPSGYTVPEQLTMGEKITSLRQLIKRFGETIRGEPSPYNSGSNVSQPGPRVRGNTEHVRTIRLDPAYFGEKQTASSETESKVVLSTGFTPTGQSSAVFEFTVAKQRLNSCPLYYISFLYRFYRGSRRYKLFAGDGVQTSSISQVVGDITSPSLEGRGMTQTEKRRDTPYIVKRAIDIRSDTSALAPRVGGSADLDVPWENTFEHTVFPDLNGVVEFEAPYYSNLPISLVSEGFLPTTQGPVIERSLLHVHQGYGKSGMDTPASTFGTDGATGNLVYRDFMGEFRMMEAAGDDFSFGYLVGAPNIFKIGSDT